MRIGSRKCSRKIWKILSLVRKQAYLNSWKEGLLIPTVNQAKISLVPGSRNFNSSEKLCLEKTAHHPRKGCLRKCLLCSATQLLRGHCSHGARERECLSWRRTTASFAGLILICRHTKCKSAVSWVLPCLVLFLLFSCDAGKWTQGLVDAKQVVVHWSPATSFEMSPCPSWPWTCGPLAFASQMLGLQVWVTTSGLFHQPVFQNTFLESKADVNRVGSLRRSLRKSCMQIRVWNLSCSGNPTMLGDSKNKNTCQREPVAWVEPAKWEAL